MHQVDMFSGELAASVEETDFGLSLFKHIIGPKVTSLVQTIDLGPGKEAKTEAEKAAAASRKLMDTKNHAQFGLKFLLEAANVDRELALGKELMEELFTALATIHYQEQQELVPVPEEDPEKEEQDPALEKAIEDAQN